MDKSLSSIPAPPNRFMFCIMLLVLLMGAAARIAVTNGDLWLDELWALEASRDLSSPWAVFGAAGLDGHSSVFTIWLRWLGPAGSFWLYRLPSLLFAFGTFLVLLRGAFDYQHTERWVLALLFAFSYVFVLYGTEARGYSAMLFFGCFAIASLRKALSSRAIGDDLFYGCSAALALLFHASFLPTLFGLALWSEWRINRRYGYPAAFWPLIRLQGIALLTVLGLFVAKYGLASSGGGPLRGTLEVVLSSVSVLLGGPEFVILAGKGKIALGLLVAIALFFLLYEIWWEWREKRSDIGLLIMIGVVAPACLVVFFRPQFLMPRYFLFSMLTLLVLWSRLLARALRKKGGWAILAVAIMAGIGTANAVSIHKLLKYGRGQYSAALSVMGKAGAVISVASDHDFRNAMLIRFYAGRAGWSQRLQYIKQSEVGRRIPRWYLAHSFYPASNPERSFDWLGASYRQEGEFLNAPLVGWTWYLYRRIDGGPPEPVAENGQPGGGK